jgi:hypothetical protein
MIIAIATGTASVGGAVGSLIGTTAGVATAGIGTGIGSLVVFGISDMNYRSKIKETIDSMKAK